MTAWVDGRWTMRPCPVCRPEAFLAEDEQALGRAVCQACEGRGWTPVAASDDQDDIDRDPCACQDGGAVTEQDSTLLAVVQQAYPASRVSRDASGVLVLDLSRVTT